MIPRLLTYLRHTAEARPAPPTATIKVTRDDNSTSNTTMVVKTIYICRHGFRLNWTLDPHTITYSANFPTPTGIPADPPLASHGEAQSLELATAVAALDPPVDAIYGSPYYRCLQTIAPAARIIGGRLPPARRGIRVETGFGEWYGQTDGVPQPRPAPVSSLAPLFPGLLDTSYTSTAEAHPHGESIKQLHDRIAAALHAVISAADAEPDGPSAILICTHAASMIAMGRALTGVMPADPCDDDFKCFTASLSRYVRRTVDDGPPSEWRGVGVKGGWDCEANADCSHLVGGEERGWHFSGDESFLRDPDAFNDADNERRETRETKL
ncbi:phosphoglycerate mutase-like protein [Trichodelitschia bisporula]|uniref:Phosphoglycerate mutase-like protein n=1 Tax=Trichodelitschia bisporula TaxID=703511 RepID=A0A6G1HJN8_9PEZI|nr:phosphoglycerate mutase-like protein [Trichodelitschia bisporula]